jgi:hypothetical protein
MTLKSKIVESGYAPGLLVATNKASTGTVAVGCAIFQLFGQPRFKMAARRKSGPPWGRGVVIENHTQLNERLRKFTW